MVGHFGQDVVERLVLVRADLLHVGEGFGAAVAVAAIVVEHAFAQGLVGGLLILAGDRGGNADAHLVGGILELLDGNAPRHLGNIFAVHAYPVRIPPRSHGFHRILRRIEKFCLGNEAEFAHPA